MQHGKTETVKAARLIKKNQAETLEISDRLHGILNNLRYEGKFFWGKNLKEIERALEFIDSEILWRAELEEDVIFPFMRTAAPKLESLIHLLKLEHDDLRKNFRLINSLLKEISRAKQSSRRMALMEQIKEIGIYLVYLLRNHIEAEDENIYKFINNELRMEEKKELKKI